MSQDSLKQTVVALRAEGKTYAEIQKNLGSRLPKSTLSYWCRNTVLPNEHVERIKLLSNEALRRGRAVAVATNKTRRVERLNSIRARNVTIVKGLSSEADKLALAMLYLGEGSKWKSHRGLMLGNSDPDIIKIYLTLLEKVYNIESRSLKCRISYRADQDISALEKFWSEETGIPQENFYKTRPDPRTLGKRTMNVDYRGVCVVMGGSTEIQLELEMIPKIVFLGR